MLIFALIAATILLGLLALVFAGITLLFAYFLAKEPMRSRKLVLAFLMPFVAVYGFFGSSFFGNVLVSVNKGFDIGIGDFFYVDISRNYSLYFIDHTESGDIGDVNDSGIIIPVISDISEIGKNGTLIFGKTCKGKSFVFDTVTEKYTIYEDENAIRDVVPVQDRALMPAGEFYRLEYRRIYGFWLYLIPIFAALLTATVVFLICKTTLRKYSSEKSEESPFPPNPPT